MSAHCTVQSEFSLTAGPVLAPSRIILFCAATISTRFRPTTVCSRPTSTTPPSTIQPLSPLRSARRPVRRWTGSRPFASLRAIMELVSARACSSSSPASPTTTLASRIRTEQSRSRLCWIPRSAASTGPIVRMGRIVPLARGQRQRAGGRATAATPSAIRGAIAIFEWVCRASADDGVSAVFHADVWRRVRTAVPAFADATAADDAAARSSIGAGHGQGV